MKKLRLALSLAAAGALFLVGRSMMAGSVPQPERGAYAHTVIFHLKKDAPADQVQTMIQDVHELLRSIPSVRDIRVGRPAERSTPDFARKDYQLALLVLFDDFDGLKTYLDHPQHLKYVEKHLKHVDTEKLAVYDFANQQK